MILWKAKIFFRKLSLCYEESYSTKITFLSHHIVYGIVKGKYNLCEVRLDIRKMICRI